MVSLVVVAEGGAGWEEVTQELMPTGKVNPFQQRLKPRVRWRLKHPRGDFPSYSEKRRKANPIGGLNMDVLPTQHQLDGNLQSVS